MRRGDVDYARVDLESRPLMKLHHDTHLRFRHLRNGRRRWETGEIALWSLIPSPPRRGMAMSTTYLYQRLDIASIRPMREPILRADFDFRSQTSLMRK
jgi:hypothetical protein